MFTIQIQCDTIEKAEQILATLKFGAGTADKAGSRRGRAAIESQPEPEGLEAARAALEAVQQKYGADNMETPLLVLGQFGAGRVSEVQPSDYGAFIAACRAA